MEEAKAHVAAKMHEVVGLDDGFLDDGFDDRTVGDRTLIRF
jgi:hypothetical protein